MSRMEFYEQVGVAMTCRSYGEYLRMFSLKEEELQSASVLDVAAGASSFGAGARLRGIRAAAVDPLYADSGEMMEARARRELEEAEAKLDKLSHLFDWTFYGSPARHRDMRIESVNLFLNDYRMSAGTEAYVEGTLPNLPFPDGTFTHVLCSHFLFLYAEQFPYEFHEKAVLDMLRVCRSGGEVRIYPLLDLKHKPYPYMDRLTEACVRAGAEIGFLKSGLPFIPGSEYLLRIVRA